MVEQEAKERVSHMKSQPREVINLRSKENKKQIKIDTTILKRMCETS